MIPEQRWLQLAITPYTATKQFGIYAGNKMDVFIN